MKYKHLIITLCACFLLFGCSHAAHAQYNAGTPIKVEDQITETLQASSNHYVYCFTAPESGYYDFVYEDCDYTEFWHEIVISGLPAKYYENQVDEEPDYAYYCEDKNIYKLTGYVKKGERYYIQVSFVDNAVIAGDKVSFHFAKHEHEWQFRSSFKNEVYYDCEHCGVVFHTKINVIASAKTFTYDGSTQMPWIHFDFAENTLVNDYANITEKIKLDIQYLPKNKFYEVTTPKSSKKVGNYKLTVTFTGDLKNIKPVTIKYQIIPNGATTSSLAVKRHKNIS